jgi:hypothetical protein
MRKSSKLRFTLLAFLAMALTMAWTGCNSDTGDCDPEQTCDAYVQPDSAAFHVKLTVDNEFTAVYLVVFKGDYDDHDTLIQDVAMQSDVSYYLPVDEFYSVAAYYVRGRNTYIAVDGDRVSASNDPNCDADCWSITEGYTNVRFKE